MAKLRSSTAAQLSATKLERRLTACLTQSFWDGDAIADGAVFTPLPPSWAARGIDRRQNSPSTVGGRVGCCDCKLPTMRGARRVAWRTWRWAPRQQQRWRRNC